MKTRNPVSALSTKMALAWAGCVIGGALLTLVDIHQVAQAGKALMFMGMGYVLFGLGVERKDEVTAANRAE